MNPSSPDPVLYSFPVHTEELRNNKTVLYQEASVFILLPTIITGFLSIILFSKVMNLSLFLSISFALILTCGVVAVSNKFINYAFFNRWFSKTGLYQSIDSNYISFKNELDVKYNVFIKNIVFEKFSDDFAQFILGELKEFSFKDVHDKEYLIKRVDNSTYYEITSCNQEPIIEHNWANFDWNPKTVTDSHTSKGIGSKKENLELLFSVENLNESVQNAIQNVLNLFSTLDKLALPDEDKAVVSKIKEDLDEFSLTFLKVAKVGLSDELVESACAGFAFATNSLEKIQNEFVTSVEEEAKLRLRHLEYFNS